jgi:CRISPR/Cas system CSM-associated protein Csm3 (group 7 of RAMP superfamily)
MSRRVKDRLVITGTLVAETPIHVGGIDGNPATDMPLSVNGLGKVYVPGTSLAGPLRHWLIEGFGHDTVETFWGRIPSKTPGDKGHASYVSIADAEVTLPSNSTPEIRDGVGIDRFRGAAAEGIKFDREVLPKGTKISFKMIFDTNNDGIGKGELRALVEALLQGDIRLGAAKTRGLGKIKLKNDFKVEHFGLQTHEGILGLLEGKSSSKTNKTPLGWLGDAAVPNKKPRIRITIDWRPLGPVMVKSSADGTGIDMIPLVTGDGNGKQAPVIPGASAKGSLRSQSERILATVDGCRLAEGTAFIDQVSRLPLIETLFGAVKKKDDRPKSQSGRGALSIDDCLANAPLAMAEWQKIADDWDNKPGNSAIPQAVNPKLDVAMHVAIDRWTGGAAEGALFSAAEPRFDWNPLVIEIDVERLVPGVKERPARMANAKHAALALFLLSLRDMVDGLVPLGFGVNRGYGDIEVTSLTIAVDNAAADPAIASLKGLQIKKGTDGRAVFSDPVKLEKVDKAWKEYLSAPKAADAYAEAVACS